jgi:DNA polymerase-3 subunit beta
MKFKIQRESLLKPLQQVSGVVERRQTLPILSNLLLKVERGELTLTATDLEVELIARTPLDSQATGEITIPARKLLDICRTLPEEARLEISVDKERAVIKSGKSRFTLSTLSAADFPKVDEFKGTKSFSVAQKDLRELIERTSFAMAQQDVRYYLNGLMLEIDNGRLRTVATDGHRLAMCEFVTDTQATDSKQVIVPRKGIHELLRILENSEDDAKVQIATNHIRVTVPDVQFTSKLIDGRFPDYKRVMPRGGDKQILADREPLRQALTRTSILSNEKYRGIRLSLEESRLSIQAHNPEQEEAEEEMEVDYSGEPIEIGFNVTYLLDALAATPGSQVVMRLSDSNSSCLIEDPAAGQCKYVVMPMRL